MEKYFNLEKILKAPPAGSPIVKTVQLYHACITIFMAALWNTAGHLWSPYVIGRPHIFSSCSFFPSSFFSSPNLSGRRLDVYHTSTHGVALVRI